MSLRSLHLPWIAATIAISALPLHADVVSYFNSQAAFDAATTGVTTYSVPLTTSNSELKTYTLGPLNFQQGVSGHPDGSYYLLGRGNFYSAAATFLELVNTTSNPEFETILLSAPSTALAFQIAGDGGTYGVAINGQVLTTLALPSTDSPVPLPSVFFGITDTTPITSISFTSNSLDTDVLFAEVGSAATAPASPVPEPSTLALLGTGTLGLLSAARRRFARI